MSIRPRHKLLSLASSCALAAILSCAGSAEPGRAVAVSAATPDAQPASQVPLPNKKDSLKFGVIGDNGNGEREG